MSTLSSTSAQREYFKRPADEKFKTLEDLHASALADRKACASATIKPGRLEAVVADGAIAVRGKDTGTIAKLTHWAMSQVSRLVSAPAGYLRTLSPTLAVANLNEGFAKLETAVSDRDMSAYFRRGSNGLTLRALTTPDYKRLHDHTVAEYLMKLRDVRPGLDLPPIWEGGNGGAYRGDRDQFVIMVDGGSIVNDPSQMNGSGKMNRGIIARNSEVGAAKWEILTFWFRWICGNHMIGGFERVAQTSTRHVGKIEERFQTMTDAAMAFFDRPASEDEARVRQLMAVELGRDRDAVVDAGRDLGLTLEQSGTSYDLAEQFEQNPRSIWGFANGITRASQDTEYQDDRLSLDLMAAKLLRRKMAIAA
jgi:hypothetical protein